jgi:hypothetical protein
MNEPDDILANAIAQLETKLSQLTQQLEQTSSEIDREELILTSLHSLGLCGSKK